MIFPSFFDRMHASIDVNQRYDPCTANEIKNSCHSLFSFESRLNEQTENFFATIYIQLHGIFAKYFISFHNAYAFTGKMYFHIKKEWETRGWMLIFPCQNLVYW